MEIFVHNAKYLLTNAYLSHIK